MTKLRDAASFPQAVTRVAGRIGWEAAALATGRAERTVRNWSDPDTDAHPTIGDALRMDAAFLASGGGEPPLLNAYRLQLEMAELHAAPTEELAEAAANCAREAGEAVSALIKAAQPGARHVDRAHAAREAEDVVHTFSDTIRKLGADPRETGPP